MSPSSPSSPSSPTSPSRRLIDVEDDLEAINTHYQAEHWSDGLPMVPPTLERVNRMLKQCPGHAQDIVAHLAPAFGPATLELIAVNAVMAGCPPELMPVLVAAVKALAQPAFNLQAVQATTNPVAVWVLVNGPLAQNLGFNAGVNCLGEGTVANATLGRAVRLLMRNVGGALPGEMDRATHGQPGRMSFCCAENVTHSPWESFHQERGFDKDESVVSVVAVEGTMNMNSHSKDALELLRIFALTMIHPPSNEYTHGGEPFLMLSPEHAHILASAGLSKSDVKAHLWQMSKMPAHYMGRRDFERLQVSRKAELGELGPDDLLPITVSPKEIQLVVAGGAGTHTVYLPCFGNSRAVSVRFKVGSS